MAFKVSNEVKLGIFGLIAAVAFVYGMSYMKGKSLFGDEIVLLAEFDRSEGILKGNPVVVSGYAVGKVDHVKLNLDKRNVTVSIRIENGKEVLIPSDSKAVLYSDGFLGGKAIKLILGKSTSYLKDGNKIKGEIETGITDRVGQEIAPIKEAVQELIGQLNGVANWTQGTLDSTHGRERVAQILNSINGTVANLEGVSRQLDGVVVNANKVLNTTDNLVANNQGAVDGVFKNVKDMSDSLAYASYQLRKIIRKSDLLMADIQGTVAGINNGEGNVGKILKDTMIYTKVNGSLEKVDGTITSVNELIDDIKKDPQKYLNVNVYVFERKKKQK